MSFLAAARSPLSRFSVVAFMLFLANAPRAHAGLTVASATTPGYEAATAGGSSKPVAVSGDGRYVLFLS